MQPKSALLQRMIAHIDAVDWRRTGRIPVARRAIYAMAFAGLSREDAIAQMQAAGWTVEQAQRIIEENGP